MSLAPDAASADRRARTVALTRTVPQEAFSEDGLKAHLAATGGQALALPDPTSGTAPMLERPSLAEQLRRHGMTAPGPTQPRFEVERVLGIGATGRVYAVRDHNLERPVAVKFLAGDRPPGPDDVRHFIQEAQITASLEHPNVLPVHELDVNDAGQVYFTMKQIDGRSLGAALEQSTLKSRARPVESYNAIASVFIGVCQALAYAHDRGVVHQDIKPDNIMLGDYGEVLLVDWGSAIRVRAGEPLRLYGTPLYMSPEQARQESVDERSDVYCLGATLFHALLLRHPTWSDDPDRFWTMKRAGEIQPPSAEERAATPAALLDIALKALAPDPRARYRTAGEMLADLRAYQAGLAVSAHRDSLLELLARWHRRHARAIWSGAAVLAVIAALVGWISGERLKEMATWGRPVVEETFADDSWRARWKPFEGEFQRRDGRLVSVARFSSKVMCARRFEGPTAVEYDGEIIPGPKCHPCDISLIWCRDLVLSADGQRVEKLSGEHRFQVGIFDGAYTAITRPDDLDSHSYLAVSEFRPMPGRVYHVRVEIVDNRLQLWIDGALQCEWLDPMPYTSGYLGLYGHYPDKAFANVRIYSRHPPQKVPVTAIGDEFARAASDSEPGPTRDQLWDQAVKRYARVAEAHNGTDVGREALYREGLCRYRQGRFDQAFGIWEDLRNTDHDELVRLHHLERELAGTDHERALADLESLYRDATPPVRTRVAMAWAHTLDRLRFAKSTDLVARYIAVHDRLFPDQHTADSSVAPALLYLGRAQQVLERYPYLRLSCTQALAQLGRQEEIVERYPDQLRQYAMALFATGQSERIDSEYNPELFAMGLVKRGLAEQAVARFPADKEAFPAALLALGRLDDVPKLITGDDGHAEWARARAMMLQGRADEIVTHDEGLRAMIALASGRPEESLASPRAWGSMKAWARHLLGMRAWIAGDREAARRWFAVEPGIDVFQDRVYFLHRFVVPFLEGLVQGDYSALDRACEDVIEHRRWSLEQIPWYQASYLAGRIDERGFLAISHKVYMDANLLVCRAMRHERTGERAAALADYRAYLALPLYRRGIEVDVALNDFVEWRARELATATDR